VLLKTAFPDVPVPTHYRIANGLVSGGRSVEVAVLYCESSWQVVPVKIFDGPELFDMTGVVSGE